MRRMFLATLALPALLLAGVVSPAIGEEPNTAKERAADEPKADDEETLRLPLGFKPKKRGKFIVYCRKESVMGTRFPVETCYDEQRIREYLLVQRENQEKVDQMRRICGSQAACGAN